MYNRIHAEILNLYIKHRKQFSYVIFSLFPFNRTYIISKSGHKLSGLKNYLVVKLMGVSTNKGIFDIII